MDQHLHIVCPHCDTTNRVLRERLGPAANCGGCKRPLLSSHPIELTAANFDRHLGSNDLPVVVDFWAPWCGPCRVIAPTLEELAEERGEDLRVVKLNVDENQMTSAQYDVMSIPTLIVFRNGEIAKKIIGALPKKRLVEELEPAIAA
jgi:thioredoxin 2